MKKNFTLSFFALLVYFILSPIFLIAQIQSVPAGGLWNLPATWVGGMIPGAGDDVVIASPGTVSVTSGAACNNLTVAAGAILQNRTNSAYTLVVNGNVSNFGTVQNGGSYSLTLSIAGDISHQGTEWSASYVNLTGAGLQIVSQNPSTWFEGINWTDTNPAGNFQAGSSLRFNGVAVNLGSGTLDLTTNSYSLDLIGDQMYSGTVRCHGNTFRMGNNAYLSNLVVDSARIAGVCQVLSGVTFQDWVRVDDSLQNYTNSSYSAVVNGNILNEGVILNGGPYTLTLNIYGDVVNNGLWKNGYTQMAGPGLQKISQGPGSAFSGIEFSSIKPSGETLALTDIDFQGCRLNMFNDTLRLAPGTELEMAGPYLINCKLQADGNALRIKSPAYLQNVSIDSVVLRGQVSVRTGVVVTDYLENSDTLQNSSNSTYTLDVLGNILNTGLIQKGGPYNFNINVAGNIENNSSWDNYTTTLNGAFDQIVTQGPSGGFLCDYFTVSDTFGKIYVNASISFDNTYIDLNSATMILTPGSDLDISGRYLTDGILVGTGNEFHMGNDAYIYNLAIDSIIMTGTAQVRASVSVSRYLQIEDTLRNDNVSTYTMDIAGDIVNNGSILSGSPYSFYMNIGGDVFNNGIWDPYSCHFNGNEDQYVSQTMGKVFESLLWNYQDTSTTLIFTTPAKFLDSRMDLNGGKMILNPGSNLEIMGEYLSDGRFWGNGNTLRMGADAYLASMQMDSLELAGLAQVRANVYFLRNLVIQDTLGNDNAFTYTTYIQGNVLNQGKVISQGPYSLYVSLTGNLTNLDVWDPYSTELDGTTDQVITQSPAAWFGSLLFTNNNSTGDIISTSSLDFRSSRIDLNGGRMIMPPGEKLILFDEYLTDGILEMNGSELNMSGDAYLNSLVISDAVFTGVSQVRSSVDLLGNNVVNDTLQNDNAFSYTLNVSGNLRNNGLIRSASPYSFYLNIQGDVVNNGVWTTNTVEINGTQTQYIQLKNHQPIASNVTLVGNLTGPGYNWRKDGAPTGITSANYNAGNIDMMDYGLYQNTSTTDTSREIIIEPLTDCSSKDAHEPNNLIGFAANLYGGVLSGVNQMTICPAGDEDWYYFVNPVPGNTAQIKLDQMPRNFDLELYDANGMLLTSSQNLGSVTDVITWPTAVNTTYYVRVYGYREAWSPEAYDLSVSLQLPAPPGGVGTKPPVQSQIWRPAGLGKLLTVHPNPANDRFFVGWNLAENATVELHLFTLEGKEVLHLNREAVQGTGSWEVPTGSLAAGIYLLRLSANGQVLNTKLSLTGK